MRKKAIAIYMTLIMLGLTACSQTEAANMDLQPESKTAEGNISLTEVNSQDVAHVIHEQHVEQEMNEESGQDGSGDMSEYIEVNPEFEGEPDIYDEAHGFRDDMSDEEPEGADIPLPDEYLSELQRDGKPLGAAETYTKTYRWLARLGCDQLVSSELVEQYSVAFARWKQCEQAVTKFGLCGKHRHARTR